MSETLNAQAAPGHQIAALEGHDKTDRTLMDQSFREAREALAIDPGSVLALHALAHGNILALSMAEDRERFLSEAISAATRAIELDGTDARSYGLRGLVVYHSGLVDRYPDALADARCAYEMNPNDTFTRGILSILEAVAGEPERAIEHGQQVLRLSPRTSRKVGTYTTLAVASFGAKQYAEGIRWASRALNDVPRYLGAHLHLVTCLVGAGEIDKARAAFAAGQRLEPEYFKVRLDGMSSYARPEDRTRQVTFLRIAAGLEDPSAAEASR